MDVELGEGADLESAPLELLETKITTMAANLAAAKAAWLRWLAVYDRRRGWESWGCRSAAHWLNWKCGMSLSAGRENVRVARALEALPRVAEAMAEGLLSYSKVRALTRVANEHNEPDLVQLALNATASQLEAICNGYRRSRDAADAASALAGRRFGVRDNGDGTATITLTVPVDAAQGAVDAVAAEASRIIDDAASAEMPRREVIDHRGGMAAIRADAATALLTGEGGQTVEVDNSGTAEPSSTAPTNMTVSVPLEALVDAPTDGGRAGRSDRFRLGSQLVDRLGCDPKFTLVVESADGTPIATSEPTTAIPRHIRRALEWRDDNTCQFPGCGATRRLHAHHINHRADRGTNALGNLILLCHFHHHLVHDGGWSVEAGTRRFLTPAGARVRLEHLRGSAAAAYAVVARALESNQLEPPVPGPLDLPWATAVVHHNEALRRRAAEAN